MDMTWVVHPHWSQRIATFCILLTPFVRTGQNEITVDKNGIVLFICYVLGSGELL